MNKKKPILEKVDPGFESSLLVKKHTEFLKTHKASWHFHPELELVYVNKGQGKRHIGNHLSYFNNSQLVIASKKFQESKMELPIALGKTISNETFVVDLAKMPNLLGDN